jgi:DNA-binding transcriptional regulator YiaG
MSAAATTPAEARRRHPCMRSPVSAAMVHERLADELDLRGARHPCVAAAVIAVRGASGLDQDRFAQRAGVDVDLLRRVEAGDVGRDELPGALRRMVPR